MNQVHKDLGSVYKENIHNSDALSLGVRASLSESRPFFLSSIALGIYVFTIITLSKDPALADASQFIGFALVGLFFMEYLTVRNLKLVFPREFFALVAFLALLIVSILWANDFDVALSICITYFQLVIFAVVAVNISIARGSIKPILVGMTAGLLWAVALAFYENGLIPTAMTDGFVPRAASSLSNPNFYGLTLLIGAVFSWKWRQDTRSRLLRLVLSVSAFLYIYQIIFFTGSRKVILSLFFLIVVYLLVNSFLELERSCARTIFNGLLLMLSIAILWWAVTESPFFHRFLRIQSDLLESKRVEQTQFGVQLWLTRPLLGHGVNQFRTLFRYPAYAHNNYVELLANNGLIGLSMFYAFFALLLQKHFRNFKSGKSTIPQFAWTLSFIGALLLLDFGVVSYYAKPVWLAYIVLVVFAYNTQSADDRSEDAPQLSLSAKQ